MATSSAEEGSQKCPICFELFVQPKKLPACIHVFCENCIFNYLSKQKPEIESESRFQCPVCRVVNPYTPNKQDLLEWIQSLESGCVAVSAEKTDGIHQNMDLCFLCEKSKKSNPAVNYCFDCQKGLCEACCEMFHSIEAVQDHSIIEIKQDDRDNDCNVTRMIAEYLACPEHPAKTVTWICEDEKKLCCPTCAFVNHRTCKQVAELKNQPSSKEDNDRHCRKLKEDINGLIAYGETIIDTLRKGGADNKPDTESIVLKIRDMRAKLNQLFDALEDTITQDCRALTKKHSLVVESDVQRVQEVIDKLLAFSSLLEKMNQNSLGLKTGNFVELLLRRMQEDFSTYARTLLETTHDFKGHGSDLKVGSMLSKFANLSINETKEMATIQETESELEIPKYTGRQLLRFSNITKTGTNGIRNRPVGLGPSNSSVLILPRDRLLLIYEEYGFCCLVNLDYQVTASLNFKAQTRKPYSAAHVKDGIVAVSVPVQKKLYLVAVTQNLKIIGELSTTYTPKALYGFNNGDIAVSWTDPVAFGVISPSSYCQEMRVYFDRDKSGRVLKTFDHMAIDEKRAHVIQPCTNDNAVYCFDFKGNPKFLYKHAELQQPTGVGVDGDGNIYVCDMSRNCIHVISDTGLPIRVFKDGCLERPSALSFNDNGNSFVIIHKSIWSDQVVSRFSLT